MLLFRLLGRSLLFPKSCPGFLCSTTNYSNQFSQCACSNVGGIPSMALPKPKQQSWTWTGEGGWCRRPLSTSLPLHKEDIRALVLSSQKRDEGVQGENVVDLDENLPTKWKMFPDENTPNLLFDGVRFADLHICHIKTTNNNSIIHVTDHRGKLNVIRSCGMEGFKNCKKGTNVAAQATGISVAQRCLEKGIKTIRVKVAGLGPGRMATVKGLQMGGMNIISITDSTRMTWGIPPRAKKQRRL